MRPTILLLAVAVVGCTDGIRQEADDYLAGYSKTYQGLAYEAALADWESNTHIVEGDSTNAVRTRKAKEALARFVGSTENIERIRTLLARRSELSPLQIRQLEVMLYNAADQPQTIAEVVAKRIAAETEQVEKLYGFDFKLGGKSVSTNEIDQKLRESLSVWERRSVWEASKAVGPRLKPGMIAIRDLRNQTVRALGYPDYFTYQVSDYGMSTPDMLALADTLIAQLRPLYRELHTWARYELAKRYRQHVPDLIPAHWLPNRWAQDWSDLITVASTDIDGALKDKTLEWTVKQGEAFYRSLGFDSLPATFWDRSSLYPAPPGVQWKKNTHASAWHLDLDRDVRSLMSVEPNAYWYGTVHHELGHVYYFMAYSRPEIPLILRGGANRAYHEGIGTMIELASSQRRYLVGRGLIAAGAPSDSIGQLLKEALSYVVFMPFGAGTMTRFEHALYADTLPPDQFNAKWWELAARYQGIAPPAARGEEFADGLTKTHITDDAAQYYDYALSQALLFQLHDHIARNILKQDPHDSDYFGSRAAGDFLQALMAPGASRPWRDVLRETTGRALDARAMVEYFQPLHDWLARENRGRKYTLN